VHDPIRGETQGRFRIEALLSGGRGKFKQGLPETSFIQSSGQLGNSCTIHGGDAFVRARRHHERFEPTRFALERS